MASKDHRSIEGDDTPYEKWDRAKTLMLESLYKPDTELRSCSHNQKCYNELMDIRDGLIEYMKSCDNPNYIEIEEPWP